MMRMMVRMMGMTTYYYYDDHDDEDSIEGKLRSLFVLLHSSRPSASKGATTATIVKIYMAMSIIFYECIHSMLPFRNGEPNHEHSPRRSVPTHLRLFPGNTGMTGRDAPYPGCYTGYRGVSVYHSPSVFLPFRNSHEDGTAARTHIKKTNLQPT